MLTVPGSLVTMVEEENGQFVARNYSEFFSAELGQAAELMEQAALVTTEPSLATFLRSRAAAFTSNDYYQSDKDWMDLDSRLS